MGNSRDDFLSLSKNEGKRTPAISVILYIRDFFNLDYYNIPSLLSTLKFNMNLHKLIFTRVRLTTELVHERREYNRRKIYLNSFSSEEVIQIGKLLEFIFKI